MDGFHSDSPCRTPSSLLKANCWPHAAHPKLPKSPLKERGAAGERGVLLREGLGGTHLTAGRDTGATSASQSSWENSLRIMVASTPEKSPSGLTTNMGTMTPLLPRAVPVNVESVFPNPSLWGRRRASPDSRGRRWEEREMR